MNRTSLGLVLVAGLALGIGIAWIQVVRTEQMKLSQPSEVSLAVVAPPSSSASSPQQTNPPEDPPSSAKTFEAPGTLSAYPDRREIVLASEKIWPDEETWYLHLVNLEHPLPDDYAPPLERIAIAYAADQARVFEYDHRAVAFLAAMLDAAREDGVEIYVTSAWRSQDYQTILYENEIQSFRNQGYDEEEAVFLGGSYVAYPGTSEHQLGLAIDLISPDHYWLDESFEDTLAFAWLSQHAASFGFILRYPKDKVEITSIAYEPWHYRYVGAENAAAIQSGGLCLEEYLLGIE